MGARGFLPGGGDVFRPGSLQDVLCARNPGGVVAVDRHEDSAVFYPALVTLRFKFRNAHADQRTNKSACRRADAETGESAHDGSCGNEWSKTRNRERSNARKQS